MEKMIIGMAAVGIAVWGCAKAPDPFEVKRAEMLDKVGNLIWNTDGCDMVYYPKNAPITEERFWQVRLNATKGSKITAIFYCPLCSGFCFSTTRKAGEFMNRTFDPEAKSYNAAQDFADKLGTDSLEMASHFARKEGKSFFVSVRMNDTHDAGHHKTKSHPFFPKWKEEHMDCLVGDFDGPGRKGVMYSWSSCDFSHPEVRDYLKKFVRDLVENYDVDGIEYDYNRHAMYFKSTFKGGEASAEEVAIMTQLMRELKAITEEVGHKRGKPILVAARTDDSIPHDRAVGYDPEEWMKEGLIDLWIAGGYSQIEPYKNVLAVGRKYPKVKVIASLDESRMEMDPKKKPNILGRSVWTRLGNYSEPFYTARLSAAMAAGFDGCYHFNLENSPLAKIAKVDPLDTDGLNKCYYATERDPFDLNWHLKNGRKFLNTPDICPGKPREIAAMDSYEFEFMVGDDFAKAAAKGKTPTCEIQMIVSGGKAQLRMNETELELKEEKDGISHYAVPVELVKKGYNQFEIFADDAIKVHDFALFINFSDLKK